MRHSISLETSEEGPKRTKNLRFDVENRTLSFMKPQIIDIYGQCQRILDFLCINTISTSELRNKNQFVLKIELKNIHLETFGTEEEVMEE